MIISPEWLTPTLNEVMCHIEEFNSKAVVYTVGGCVRDAILGIDCDDVDLSTNLTPNEVKEVFTPLNGYKLYDTGLKHGTWTLVVNGQTFEITTFRRDVVTDGRHAEVEFAETMEEDAERRDFTMNALYADREGNVFDPTGTGISDIKEKHIRFVGDASLRCQEDYLRILRFFRFCGKLDIEPSEEAIEAIKPNIKGLIGISGERKWAELKKIMSVRNPLQILARMSTLRILKEMNISCDLTEMAKLSAIENETDARTSHSWARRYYALTGGKEIPFPVSKAEKNLLIKLREAKGMKDASAATTHGAWIAVDAALLNGRHFDKQEIERGLKAKFPLTSQDFISIGFEGKQISKAINAAKNAWIVTDLTANVDTLFEEGKKVGSVAK